jgi:Yip1 domain
MPISLLQLGWILFQPNRIFARLAETEPSPLRVFFGLTLWLALLPPVFTFIGTTRFGWLLGVEPMFLPTQVVLAVSLAYLAMLLLGFFSTALVSRWMAATYHAADSLGLNFALITIVGAPLAVGSIVHLYPDVLVNVLVLVPTLIWSLYLLYRGLPVVLKTGPERGMLMASALVGYLLVAWVSLIGVTVVLWSHGFGPEVGV